MTVPLWNKDEISHIPDSRPWLIMWVMLAKVLWEKDIVGQNFNYDRDKLGRLGFAIRRIHSDTMLKAFAINPELPKGLAFLQVSTPENPSTKMRVCMKGSLEISCSDARVTACVTFEINEAMDSDLDELGCQKVLRELPLKST